MYLEACKTTRSSYEEVEIIDVGYLGVTSLDYKKVMLTLMFVSRINALFYSISGFAPLRPLGAFEVVWVEFGPTPISYFSFKRKF